MEEIMTAEKEIWFIEEMENINNEIFGYLQNIECQIIAIENKIWWSICQEEESEKEKTRIWLDKTKNDQFLILQRLKCIYDDINLINKKL